MSAAAPLGRRLHLPDLEIRGFGGIRDLRISRLGRVTLIAGKNGVGKTTILDAIRVYASRGSYSSLTNFLEYREELLDDTNEDGREASLVNWESLFYGRRIATDTQIRIGTVSEIDQLTIEATSVDDDMQLRFEDQFSEEPPDSRPQVLKVTLRNDERRVPMYRPHNTIERMRVSRRNLDTDSDKVPCESLGPGIISNATIARFWDKVALTDEELRAVQALNLVFDNTVSRVAMISGPRTRRRAVVRLAGEDRPVPLKSLGEGATRLFGIALALANSKNGFLLIDEAENGIHHSIQRDFWKMILKTSLENNVQVLATTHGWDCVAGFVQAATELPEAESAIIRIERDGEEVHAVEYPSKDLSVIDEQGIEVR